MGIHLTMRILLTNDDGIYAEGLWVLFRELSHRHAVSVVAPDRERSAIGHAITLHQPLRTAAVQLDNGCRGIAVTGTPADCVKLGLQELLTPGPEMVIAGINPGSNTGVNLNYSGTVSAAREAALFGLPAIAVSMQAPGDCHFADAARFILALAETVYRQSLPRGTFLNVNLPDRPLSQVRGVRICRQAVAPTGDSFEKRVDPRNRVYYWQGRENPDVKMPSDTDGAALRQNRIAITPIQADMTDYRAFEILKEMNLETGCP